MTSRDNPLERVLHRPRGAPAPWPATAAEPCATCGEETAVGSVLFSDRHELMRPDGSRAWWCSLCDSRIRASAKGRRFTDEEVRSAIQRGTIAGIALSGGGPNVGF